VAAVWPQVLEAVRSRSKVAHTLAEGSSPSALTGRTLVVAHPDASRLSFLRKSTAHLAALTDAAHEVTGIDLEIDLTLDADGAARSTSGSSADTAPPAAGDPGTSAARTPDEGGTRRPESEEDLTAPDDIDADDSDVSPLALLQRELGGSVMDEYDRS
jgi:DNA polymerase-3 subunit gamma/tau